ncbi:class I SAM-dependent methyltransferase [Patescibacteria group bacterium]|nr:MAG: class I SAM-dependent methyltransferase [Patescibacteria group bacterium]
MKIQSMGKIIPLNIQRMIRSIFYNERKLRKLDTKTVFTDIYRNNSWGDAQSISGTGSNLEQTEVTRKELQKLFSDFNIKAILDIPCGDFHWMKHVDLRQINYTGGDIVEEIIIGNKKYEKENIRFENLDLTKDDLPKSNLILVRDCLVHLSYNDIFQALQNICRSKSTYLLTTTFAERTSNSDIFTGQWRPLNLEKPPFALPKPIQIINEQCTEEDGQYADKSLGLWKVDDIARHISRLSSNGKFKPNKYLF